MYSAKLELIRNNRKDNFGFIQLRTIENSVIKRKSLKIRVNKSDWDKYFDKTKQRFKEVKSFPDAKEFNTKINEYLNTLKSVGNQIELMPDESKSFISYWNQLIKTSENHGTSIKHQVVLNKLKKYLTTIGKSDLRFIEITPSLLRELKLYFKNSKDPKTLSNNSIAHYLKVIKSIINHAQKENHYHYIIDPFITFKFTKEKIEKAVIKEWELTKLLNTKIEDKNIDLARKMFLFQLFSNGMRVSDLLLLRWNNFVDSRLKYKMFKTGSAMDIYINLNMSLVLGDLLGKQNRFNDLVENIATPMIIKNKIEKVKLSSIDEQINKIAVKETRMNVEKIISLKSNPEIIKKDGFFIDKKNEKEFINLMNAKENLLNEIELIYTGSLMGAIGAIGKLKNLDDFVFPILNNKEFNNIGSENDFSKISLQQYKSLKHSTIVYNRKLKEVSQRSKIETELSSHVARHSFTNLLLNMDNVNLYDVSQSLGHKNITITQSYIQSGFNSQKVDYINKNLSRIHRKNY